MPTDSFFVLARRDMKIRLMDFLRENPSMELEQALAVFSLKTGLRVERVKTYYQELKQAKVIE